MMNKYIVVTEYAQYKVEAAELTTEYEKDGGFDYVIAFDETGQSVAYFKRVIYWMRVKGENE